MRRLLLFAISILGLFMFAPHGVLMNTPDTGQGNEPVLMQDGPAPQAVLMHSPNGVLMHDPSGVLMGDPISGRTLALALLGVNYQNALAMIFGPRSNTVAFTFCVRKPTPERPLIVTTRNPLALRVTLRSAVRA